MKTLAQRVRECREESGLTQEQLAERAGTGQFQVSAVEMGNSQWPRNILALAEALEVPP